jgi:hypothetical protein
MPTIQFVIVDAIICLVIAGAIGSNRGRGGDGVLLGLLLGPLGVLLALTLKPTPAYVAARAEEVEAERRKLRGEPDPAPETSAGPPTA